MAGSTFGTIFKITTWGESHGTGIGVVIDGCPAGLPLCGEDIRKFLDRRKPGQSGYSTSRKEDDAVEILSGIFEGRTTGTPVSLAVFNKDQRSKDYSEIASCYRPGHADYTFDRKYGFRDYRGGGRSSGRETIGRVAAGAVAVKLLNRLGITFLTYTKSIGPVCIRPQNYDPAQIGQNPFYMPDRGAAEEAGRYLDACMADGNSAGGVVECIVEGLPAGVGDPVFEKLDANLAKALMSIGAVKAVEIGDGVQVSKAAGSENNDPFVCENNVLSKKSNHAGGILGGISDGAPVVIRAHIKPTPSIFQTQETVNRDMENINIQIKGRHDPVIVPRAVVVVESMTALAVLDACMQNMTARLEYLTGFYKNSKN